MKLSIINNQTKIEKSKILNCNKFLQNYGISLSQQDAEQIIEKRIETLRQTKRIELGEWVVEKIIKEFCDSAYISQDNFVSTVYELIDIFYYYKNETNDLVSDEEIIKFMREYYDSLAHGDLEYLAGTIMEKMKNNILNNKPLNYELEENESEETDEF